MLDNLSDIIGFFAATLTTVSFVPQVFKIVQTKDTKSISLFMYIVFATGVFLWFTYGLLLKDMPIICANLVTLVLVAIVLRFKIKYG